MIPTFAPIFWYIILIYTTLCNDIVIQAGYQCFTICNVRNQNYVSSLPNIVIYMLNSLVPDWLWLETWED